MLRLLVAMLVQGKSEIKKLHTAEQFEHWVHHVWAAKLALPPLAGDKTPPMPDDIPPSPSAKDSGGNVADTVVKVAPRADIERTNAIVDLWFRKAWALNRFSRKRLGLLEFHETAKEVRAHPRATTAAQPAQGTTSTDGGPPNSGSGPRKQAPSPLAGLKRFPSYRSMAAGSSEINTSAESFVVLVAASDQAAGLADDPERRGRLRSTGDPMDGIAEEGHTDPPLPADGDPAARPDGSGGEGAGAVDGEAGGLSEGDILALYRVFPRWQSLHVLGHRHAVSDTLRDKDDHGDEAHGAVRGEGGEEHPDAELGGPDHMPKLLCLEAPVLQAYRELVRHKRSHSVSEAQAGPHFPHAVGGTVGGRAGRRASLGALPVGYGPIASSASSVSLLQLHAAMPPRLSGYHIKRLYNPALHGWGMNAVPVELRGHVPVLMSVRLGFPAGTAVPGRTITCLLSHGLPFAAHAVSASQSVVAHDGEDGKVVVAPPVATSGPDVNRWSGGPADVMLVSSLRHEKLDESDIAPILHNAESGVYGPHELSEDVLHSRGVTINTASVAEPAWLPLTAPATANPRPQLLPNYMKGSSIAYNESGLLLGRVHGAGGALVVVGPEFQRATMHPALAKALGALPAAEYGAGGSGVSFPVSVEGSGSMGRDVVVRVEDIEIYAFQDPLLHATVQRLV